MSRFFNPESAMFRSVIRVIRVGAIGALAVANRQTLAQTADVAAPTKLWAAQNTINQITLVWKLAPGAMGYVLYRDAGAGGGGPEGQAKVANLAANSSRYVYIVRAAPQQVQQFYLQATDANGRASAKVAFNPVTLVNAAVPAVPPASVTAKESSPGVITVTWTPSPGATAYALGRMAGGSGLANLCAICPTEPTYVDSGVTNGVRYQYSVAAITPTAVSLRTMSNVLTPGVVATTGGTGGAGGTGGTGGTGTPVDTIKTTPVDSIKTTPVDSVPPGTPNPDPVHGRYRVTLTGFSVTAQTYDNPFQIDGKGDEVYFATHVMTFDTTAANIVVANEVRTSRIYGDINGFSYRVKAGTAGSTGGLATGNTFPGSTPKTAATDIPMVLWEGELIQGRSAVVVVPTVWEWDDNPELFGNWLTGRDAVLARFLLQPELMAGALLNTDLQPFETGSGGLFVHTNMFGDARDRPVGLRPGQPANNAGFFSPLPLDQSGKPTVSYASKIASVVTLILGNSPLGQQASSLLSKLFQFVSSFAGSLGTTNAHLALPTANNLPGALGSSVAAMRPKLRTTMLSQPTVALRQFQTVLASALTSGISSDLYLFEKMVALTPRAIEDALSRSKTPGATAISVQYTDYTSLQGKYTLYLKVERLP